MKIYTKEERTEAMKNLPQPIADFAKSDTITEIYLGLQKKHKLNIWEISVVSNAANVALLGLESEGAVEPAIHQELPEISNAVMRELIADINDRIFKEAKRRLKENILEEEPWDEVEHGPKPTEEQMKELAERVKLEQKDDDNPEVLVADEKEIERILKQDKIDAKVAEDEMNAMLEERARKAALTPLGPEETPGAPGAPGQTVPGGPSANSKETIAERRLLGTTIVKPTAVTVKPDTSAPPPSSGTATTGAPTTAPEKNASVKIDPYREQI